MQYGTMYIEGVGEPPIPFNEKKLQALQPSNPTFRLFLVNLNR